nr:YnbE family lipoprotein [uncultured Novosphingobium sp.]
MMMTGLGSALAGCVNVTAPDKPIVIELNINIRQEVIYRLSQDAENTIKENEGVF